MSSMRRSGPEPILSERQRSKQDTRPDRRFYRQPRFVQHVDAHFRERLTDLYREQLAPGDAVLDLMSSWVSHLPSDMSFSRVVGHGMNENELAANDRLTDFFVQDLNCSSGLPLDDETVDATVCAVSVQYLQYPAQVFAEVGRMLRPGGVVVVSFSRWMFEQKAVRAWREASAVERLDLVEEYLTATGLFEEVETVSEESEGKGVFSPNAPDPFYAAHARRKARD